MNVVSPLKKHLVITVHGIRTNGNWQEALRSLIKEVDQSITIVSIKFGVLPLLFFKVPLLRNWQSRKVASDLRRLLLDDDWDQIDIVAHSFGTYLLGQTLTEMARNQSKTERKRIRKVILSGCVLSVDFDWTRIQSHLVDKVYNYAGSKDWIPWIAGWAPGSFGPSGLSGFRGVSGDALIEQKPDVGHSGFFSDEFMRTYWVPLITKDEFSDIPYMPKPPRFAPLGWLSDKLSSPPKLFAYTTFFGFLIGLGIVAHDVYHWRVVEIPHSVQERLTQDASWLMANERPGEQASRYALAAAMIEPNSDAYDALLLADSQSIPVQKSFRPSLGEAVSTAISADGRLLAMVGRSRDDVQIDIVDVISGRSVRAPLTPTSQDINVPCSLPGARPMLEFTPKSTHLVVSGTAGSCIFDLKDGSSWDLPGAGQVLVDEEETRGIGAGMFINSARENIIVFDFKTHVTQKYSIGAAWFNAVDLSPTGVLAVAQGTGEIDFFTASDTGRVRCGGEKDQPRSIKFTSENRLAVGTEAGRLCLIDLSTRKEIWSIETGTEIAHIAFSPNGTRMVEQHSSGAVVIRHVKSGEREFDLKATGYPVGVSFMGDSNLISANRGDDVRLWSTETGHLKAMLHRDVRQDTLSTSGSLVAAIGAAGEALLWDTNAISDHWTENLGEEIKRIERNRDGSVVLAFGDHLVKIWEAKYGNLITAADPIHGREGVRIEDVSLSPDGRMFSVAMTDGVTEFRDARSGKVLWALPSAESYSATFALKDGRSVKLGLVDFPTETNQHSEHCEGEVPVVKATAPQVETANVTNCNLAGEPIYIRAPVPWFSPEGSLAAVPMGDIVYLYRAVSGEKLATLRHGAEWWPDSKGEDPILVAAGVTRVSFVGDKLLTLTQGGVLRSWGFNTDKPEILATRILSGKKAGVFSSVSSDLVYILKDKNLLSVGVADLATQKVMPLHSKRVFDTLERLPGQDGKLAIVSHDPPQLVVLGEGAMNVPYYISVYDKFGGTVVREWSIDHPVQAIDVSSNGDRFVVSDSAGVTHVFDVSADVHTEWFVSTIPAASAMLGLDGKSVLASVGPSGTWGHLVGTDQISSRNWDFDDVEKQVCRSLSEKGRDLSELVEKTGRKLSCQS